MGFSLADVQNIMAGTPTAETMAAAEMSKAVATRGLPQPAPQRGQREPLMESRGGDGPIDMEAQLQRRVAAKAARLAETGGAPAPQVLQEQHAPAAPAPQAWQQPAAPNPGAPLAGYPMPGIPTIPGKAAGTFNPDQGGVPPDAMAQLLGLAAPVGPSAAQRLHESIGQVTGVLPRETATFTGTPTPPPAVLRESAAAPAPAAPGHDELTEHVREILFQEILDDKVLAPLLEQLVKTHLRTIVREELTRLAEKGTAQSKRG